VPHWANMWMMIGIIWRNGVCLHCVIGLRPQFLFELRLDLVSVVQPWIRRLTLNLSPDTSIYSWQYRSTWKTESRIYCSICLRCLLLMRFWKTMWPFQSRKLRYCTYIYEFPAVSLVSTNTWYF
jgi:hypothetical protein